jgi:hypothetical protein
MREGSGYSLYEYASPAAGPGAAAPPPPRRRRGVAVATHLAVAVLAAGAAVGVTLGVYHPAGSAASAQPSLPGAGAVPSPAASPAGGSGSSGGE